MTGGLLIIILIFVGMWVVFAPTRKAGFQKSAAELYEKRGEPRILALDCHKKLLKKFFELDQQCVDGVHRGHLADFMVLKAELKTCEQEYLSFYDRAYGQRSYNEFIDKVDSIITQIEETIYSSSEDLSEKARVIAGCLNLKDTKGNPLFAKFANGLFTISSTTTGCLPRSQIAQKTGEIGDFMGMENLSFESDGTVARFYTDNTVEHLKELSCSSSFEDRAKALSYAFDLTDPDGNYLQTTYSDHLSAVIVTSERGAVPMSKIKNILPDIRSYLGKDDYREITSFTGEIHIHGDDYNNPSVSIPSLVRPDEVSHRTNSITFGLTFGGKEVSRSLDELTHILITGQSGSGKSIFMNWLITSLHQFCDRVSHVRILDLKSAVGYSFLKDKEGFSVGHTKENVEEYLDETIKVMESRYEQMISRGIENWDGKFEFLIIDEFAIIATLWSNQESKRIGDKLMKLSQQGRAAGIRLIIGLQRASKGGISIDFKSNLQTQFVFSSVDMGSVELAFGESTAVEEKGWHPKYLKKGRAIAYIEGNTDVIKVQVPFASMEYTKEVFDASKNDLKTALEENLA
ncbi:FtsK/SpoIIIE domain-containing protein [Vibrio parahaemolyticus]